VRNETVYAIPLVPTSGHMDMARTSDYIKPLSIFGAVFFFLGFRATPMKLFLSESELNESIHLVSLIVTVNCSIFYVDD